MEPLQLIHSPVAAQAPPRSKPPLYLHEVEEAEVPLPQPAEPAFQVDGLEVEIQVEPELKLYI